MLPRSLPQISRQKVTGGSALWSLSRSMLTEFLCLLFIAHWSKPEHASPDTLSSLTPCLNPLTFHHVTICLRLL